MPDSPRPELTLELYEEAKSIVADHDDIRTAIQDLDRINIEVEHYRRVLHEKREQYIAQEHLIAALVIHHRKGGRYAAS